jgi:hypothetical protein
MLTPVKNIPLCKTLSKNLFTDFNKNSEFAKALKHISKGLKSKVLKVVAKLLFLILVYQVNFHP